jgi:hypothetical protein
MPSLRRLTRRRCTSPASLGTIERKSGLSRLAKAGPGRHAASLGPPGRPGARERSAGSGVGNGAARRADLDEFVAVGVGRALDEFGTRSQVDAQFVTVACGVSAEGSQHLVRVGADTADFGQARLLGGLGAGGFLLGQPGCLFRLPGRVARLTPVGLGGADQLADLGARLADPVSRSISAAANLGGGFSADRLEDSGSVDLGGGVIGRLGRRREQPRPDRREPRRRSAGISSAAASASVRHL